MMRIIAALGSWLYRVALADKVAALAAVELELQAARAEIAILRLSLDLTNEIVQREFARVRNETEYLSTNRDRR